MNVTLLAQRLLDGLANGSLYGSLALALVVVYRASGGLNLAQGELSTVGTYLTLVMGSVPSPALAGTVFVSRWIGGTPWPLWFAMPVAIAASAVLAALIERLVVRRIPERSPQASVSVTIGLLLLINALVRRVWKPAQRGFPSPFPNSPRDQFVFGGARLRYTTIGTWVTLIILLSLLWAGLRLTKAGLAFRAVSSSRTQAALSGIRVGRVLTGGWALAAALGTLVGCLMASRLVLNPDLMIRLLVYAFAAATIGGLASMGGALVGGLIVGVGQSLLSAYVPFIKSTLSLPAILTLMALMLYVRPSGLFGGRAGLAGPPAAADPVEIVLPDPPRRVLQAGTTSAHWARRGVLATAALIAIAPAFLLPYLEARLWTEFLATAIVLWGLGLLMGQAGQISLGHGAFVGIGAYGTAIVAARYHWPPLSGIAVSTVAGFLVGMLIGLPALRIRGQYLAMVTLSAAVAFPMVIGRFSWFTGGELGPPPTATPRAPSWLPLPHSRPFGLLHLVTVGLLFACGIGLHNLRRSRIGRAIRAGAENETAALTMGINLTLLRTITFGLAAALAALGGSVIALQTQAVTTASFDLFRSLALYALVVLCGTEWLLGGVLGAFVLVGTPYLITEAGWKISSSLIYGFLLVIGTAFLPGGVAPSIYRWIQRRVAFVESVPISDPTPSPGPPATLTVAISGAEAAGALPILADDEGWG